MPKQGFEIRGLKPQRLSAAYSDDLKGEWDPREAVLHLVAQPLFTPLTPTTQPAISYDGVDATPEEVADLICKSIGPNYDPEVEEATQELFAKTLINYVTSLNTRAEEVFACQASAESNLEPYQNTGRVVIYDCYGDVIPAAKALLADEIGADKRFFTCLAWTFHPQILGFWMKSEQTFEDFKLYCMMRAQDPALPLTSDAKIALQSLKTQKLDECIASFLLRGDDDTDPGNDEGSFARFIVACAQEFADKFPDAAGIMPFALSELVQPSAIAFVNVDAHAHSLPQTIKAAWNDVIKAMANRPTVVPLADIANLTALEAAQRKAQQKAERAASKAASEAQAQRQHMRFRKTQPKAPDLAKMVGAIMKRMGQVMRSENAYKDVRKTIMRPNRRDPDDLSKQGKILSTKYKPDIHIYLDTSGSISEENYQSAVFACIRIATKMNVNLYINSFSDTISQCAHVETRNRTAKDVYNKIERIPKVTGGTNFRLVWDYILASKKRQKEFSLMITDFEWWVPNGYVEHPKNLYYYPISCSSAYGWQSLVHEAKDFAEAMYHIDPKIRRKMLF